MKGSFAEKTNKRLGGKPKTPDYGKRRAAEKHKKPLWHMKIETMSYVLNG